MTPENVFSYNSYGVTCTEVLLDILTGEHEILRTDMLYDCGERSDIRH
jgi:xanthine dehydrogenase/oxidase